MKHCKICSYNYKIRDNGYCVSCWSLIKAGKMKLEPKMKKLKKKIEFTNIDYTLEQYFAERKRIEIIINTLSKIANVLDKLEKNSQLINMRINRIERKLIKEDRIKRR